MKLRLGKNSLRLRLTEQDIEDFKQNRCVEEKIIFGAGCVLTFSLEISTVKKLSATFSENKISVFVPEQTAAEWLKSSEIGFEGEQRAAAEDMLKIAVERDLGYKKPRRDKEEAIKLYEV